jgi:ATP-dependent Lon protease
VELNALTPDQVRVTDGALKTIVTGFVYGLCVLIFLYSIKSSYTREAGVRSLERSIAAVVRHKAYEWAESQDGSDHDSSSTAATGSYTPVVEEQHLEKILGISWSNGDDLQREEHIGTVYGLVVSGAGEVCNPRFWSHCRHHADYDFVRVRLCRSRALLSQALAS